MKTMAEIKAGGGFAVPERPDPRDFVEVGGGPPKVATPTTQTVTGPVFTENLPLTPPLRVKVASLSSAVWKAPSEIVPGGAESGIFDDRHAARLLERDGVPFEGETVVRFLTAEKAVHFFLDGSARIVTWWGVEGFGPEVELPRYYSVSCRCETPRSRVCALWSPKTGHSSALYKDACVALGRLPRKGDNLTPAKLYAGGRAYVAEVGVVRTDRKGNARTPWSKITGLVGLA